MSHHSIIANATVGIGGTASSIGLAQYSGDAATIAGLATAAWMLRQLWLSFRRDRPGRDAGRGVTR